MMTLGTKVFGQFLQTLRFQEKSVYKLGGLVQLAQKTQTSHSTRRRHEDFLKEPEPIPYEGRHPRKRDRADVTSLGQLTADDIIQKVNHEIKCETQNRLFAVIHVGGKQFKVTTEDIIMIQGYWAPDVGDRIRLEKVLLAGSPSFTLVGRPLLPPDLVKIEGTIVEKTLSFTQLHFVLKKRKNCRRLRFDKIPLSMVRINSIDIVGLVDEFKEVEGLRDTAV